MKLRSLIAIGRIKILDCEFQTRAAFAHLTFVCLRHVGEIAGREKLVAFARVAQLAGKSLCELDRKGIALRVGRINRDARSEQQDAFSLPNRFQQNAPIGFLQR
jgi:hypothetical protein